MADITTYHLYTLVGAIMMCLLYPTVAKNHSNPIAKENIIDSKTFDKLPPFEFLFLNKEKKSVKRILMKQFHYLI